MSTKVQLIIALIWALGSQAAWAQTRTITGRVVDQQSNQGLPGVTVLVQGTTVGTATDVGGNFTLDVPPTGTTLLFSFIGYRTVERAIGDASVINVGLVQDTRALGEVVVTAVGIERQRRELGYATEDLSGDQVAQRSEPNMVNAMQGKVAGVEIISQSGMPGAATQIFIRGLSSATGNNQPLFVVDGIPIDNSTVLTQNATVGGAAYSNRALDINPNDVESMTILKGPAAAALYGSRAGNGAVIITTKRGRMGDANKKFEVTVNSSYNTQEVYGLPRYQNEYGQGVNGRYNNSSTDSWGPRFGTPGIETVPNVAGNPLETLPYRAVPDNVRDFFNRGQILDNGLQLSGGGNNVRYIFSGNSTNQQGIVPNSSLDRITLRAAGNAILSHGITMDGSVMYARTDQFGSLQGNSGASPWFTLPFIPRSIDLHALPYKLRPGVQAPTFFTQLNRDNPMWTANESFYESEVNRTITSATLNWTPTFFPSLTFTYRAGLDQWTDQRLEAVAYGSFNSNGNTAANRQGSQIYDNLSYSQFNQDIFGIFTRDLTEDLNLRVLVGTQLNNIRNNNRRIRAEDLLIPEFYNLSNHANTTLFPTNFRLDHRLVGTYAQLGLNYRNWLFLELQGRNDWSSTLPSGQNSYFYPAASLGLVFTDLLNIDSPVLSYGKLRGNFARVGQDAFPYMTNTVFLTQAFGNNVAGISFPFAGNIPAQTRNNRRGNMELLPEFRTSIEVGGEFTFFNGRTSLDVNYFNNRNTSQIFNVTVPGSTGFTTFTDNAGRIDNWGWEIAGTVTPIDRTNGLRYDLDLNFTAIRSNVVALAPGLNEFNLSGGALSTTGQGGAGFTGLSPLLIPGQQFGVFQGNRFLRNAEGQFVINRANGLPIVDQNPAVIGDPNANWWTGLNNRFSFRGFTLQALLQYVHGGDFYSRQTQIARLRGTLEEQGGDRERPFMFQGVLANADGTASTEPNNIQITAQEYWTALQNATEFAIFDASVFRLRELAIGYTFPAALLANSPFGSASITFTGRNLFFFAPNLPHADPEANQLGGNIRGFEFNSPPAVRNYGVNVRFTF